MYQPEILQPVLGNELVSIFVGLKRKEFCVHKSLLYESSEFFEKVFRGGFKEGQEKKMYLPEDSPDAFSLFVDWLYRDTIRTDNTQRHLTNLYDLYIFAEKTFNSSLSDKTLDRIQDIPLKYDRFVSFELLRKVYENTMSRSHLRAFCLHVAIYDHFEKTKDIREQEEKKAQLVMDAGEFEKLWEFSKENREFFKDFMTALQGCVGKIIGDPRMRDDKVREDRCYFHGHDNGSDWPWEVEQEDQKDWVDD